MISCRPLQLSRYFGTPLSLITKARIDAQLPFTPILHPAPIKKKLKLQKTKQAILKESNGTLPFPR